MTLQEDWIKDGSPFILAHPIADMTAMFRSHGYPVESYPDKAHQVATPAQDHCPYSQTPYPGTQPYPYCLALDLMPHADPAMPSLAAIGQQMFTDKQNGALGMAWLKYQNWTDSNNNCWHDSWQPSHVRKSSTDRGHIHQSGLTNFYLSNSAAEYDPILSLMGEIMSVIVRCQESGGFYSYPVPKWFVTQDAANAAAAAYGAPIITVATANDVRNRFGYIPGSASLIAMGLADVLADAHGNVLPPKGGAIADHAHHVVFDPVDESTGGMVPLP